MHRLGNARNRSVRRTERARGTWSESVPAKAQRAECGRGARNENAATRRIVQNLWGVGTTKPALYSAKLPHTLGMCYIALAIEVVT